MSVLQRASTTVAVSPETMLPDLIREHPATRHVFDRYGLRGCGGDHGPVESVGFFARAHGVPEGRLIAELEAVLADPASVAPAPVAADAHLADRLYRPFFLSGIAVGLSVGATWGMLLLWRIGVVGDFTAISIHDVNAHGHAQIFGWVGLFIMGFAYQAFPRIWHTSIQQPRLAMAVLAAMVVGLVLRTIGMADGLGGGTSVPLAMVGGGLELLAVLVFVVQIVLTAWQARVAIEPYVAFVLAGLGWFVLMAAVSLWHTWNTLTAGTTPELLWYVATWQAPLRDLQIHGLVLFMIVGVSLRMLPGLFGLEAVPRARAWAAFGMLVCAVVGEIGLFLAYRFSDNRAFAAALLLPWSLLAIGCGLIAVPWRFWRPFPEGDRSEKYVRAAWGWLAVSLLMLLATPAHQVVSGLSFSHAYYGGIRHAITVGFVSLMIMGIAAKVVPTLNGLDTRTLGQLWLPFVLVNLGCAMRVTTQVMTDFVPVMFAVIGVSGTLEVVGIAIWGSHLLRIFRLADRASSDEGSVLVVLSDSPPPRRLTGDESVADVLRWSPETRQVFLDYGFTPLMNPVMSRTMARRTSLRQAARFRQVDEDTLLADLNQVFCQPEG